METRPRAPHFLRVTQALAFVSGLGTCAVVLLGMGVEGCGGEEGCARVGSCFAPEGDAAQHEAAPSVLVLDASDASHAAESSSGIGPAAEDSGLADVRSPPGDAGTPDVRIFNGVAPPPDLDAADAAPPK
jgi:hypothetical protein